MINLFISLEILPTKDTSHQKAREAYLIHKGNPLSQLELKFLEPL